MNLYIKNMVCNRCIMVATSELKKLGLQPLNVVLGEVVLQEKKITKEQTKALQASLLQAGFELIDDRKSKLIGQLKNIIVELVHYSEPMKVKYSSYIADKLHQDYSYLSKLFSEVEGIT